MPEYFFHVSLELFPNPDVKIGSAQEKVSSLNSGAALTPFLHAAAPLIESSPSIKHRRSHNFPSKSLDSQLHTIGSQPVPSNVDDHRLDQIYIDGTNMTSQKQMKSLEEPGEIPINHITRGIGTSTAGLQTKGRYVPLEQGTTEAGFGIVHLYRDAEETLGLYGDYPPSNTDIWSDGVHKKSSGKPHPRPKDEECTTLCILAVPSYLAPSDFLAFVGEETRNEVSHFRMIRTSRANRYMVLMKFRHGKKAKEWQHEWNGKVFNSMEPETCHVVFLRSVEIIQSQTATDPRNTDITYPKTPNDPFSISSSIPPLATSLQPTVKPLPPPTPSLIELPTCPVCLERMDETTGLLTILCQHVFHCTCLQKWSGGGCPVCRYTHDDFSSRLSHTKHQKKKKVLRGSGMAEYELDDYDGYGAMVECETCHAEENLWQCLICGKVGCGRYEGKHAFAHFEETGHSFSMDLESKRVWDYQGDGYVHRIIQDVAGVPGGEKLVELPGGRGEGVLDDHKDRQHQDDDAWAIKMDGLALEYTHLLTSQLESQRVYFEEVLERAVDKASDAARRATENSDALNRFKRELDTLKPSYSHLQDDVLPGLEKERDRLHKRAEKFEQLSREMEKKYQSEHAMAGNLLERVKFLESESIAMKSKVNELEEENRDLLLNFTMGEKFRQMTVQEGAVPDADVDGLRGVDADDLIGGTVGVPEPPQQKKKGKGKGKR